MFETEEGNFGCEDGVFFLRREHNDFEAVNVMGFVLEPAQDGLCFRAREELGVPEVLVSHCVMMSRRVRHELDHGDSLAVPAWNAEDSMKDRSIIAVV